MSSPDLPFHAALRCSKCRAVAWSRADLQHARGCSGGVPWVFRLAKLEPEEAEKELLAGDWSPTNFAAAVEVLGVGECSDERLAAWASWGRDYRPSLVALDWASVLASRVSASTSAAWVARARFGQVLDALGDHVLADELRAVLQRMAQPVGQCVSCGSVERLRGRPRVVQRHELESTPSKGHTVRSICPGAGKAPRTATGANAPLEVSDAEPGRESSSDLRAAGEAARADGHRSDDEGGLRGRAEGAAGGPEGLPGGVERQGDVARAVDRPAGPDVEHGDDAGGPVHHDEDGAGVAAAGMAGEPGGHAGGRLGSGDAVEDGVHPAARMFELVSLDELEALSRDIVENGQREPGKLLDGLLIDGRNRRAARELAGLDRWEVELEGAEREAALKSPARWVFSVNRHRRHLTTKQLAFAGARLAEQLKAEAAQRQAASRLAPGEQPRPAPRGAGLTDAPADGADPYLATVKPTVKHSDRGWADDAAAMLGGQVSPRTIERAAAVTAAVKDGRALPELEQLPPARAELLSMRSIEEQRAAIASADPKVLRKFLQEQKKEDNEKRKRNQAERLAAANAEAASRLPPLPGIELVQGAVYEKLRVIPLGSIDFLVADPPWLHRDKGGTGAAEQKYPCMPMNLIISDLVRAYERCTENAVFIVWVSGAVLEEYFDATRRADQDPGCGWPWQYKQMGVWGKDRGGRLGKGKHERNDAEIYLLYVKGNPPVHETISNVAFTEAAVTEHSEKPLVICKDHIATHCPKNGRVLELYAGRAPYARGTLALGEGRTYRGIEILPSRIEEARAELTRHLEMVADIDAAMSAK